MVAGGKSEPFWFYFLDEYSLFRMAGIETEISYSPSPYNADIKLLVPEFGV
jgi:hypothetical protein